MYNEEMGSGQMVNTSEQPAGPVHSWPEPQSADPAVNVVLAALTTLADKPVPEHHAVYTALHDGLLAELNAEPAEEH